MKKVNYEEAREMLNLALDRYIEHNQQQLHNINQKTVMRSSEKQESLYDRHWDGNNKWIFKPLQYIKKLIFGFTTLEGKDYYNREEDYFNTLHFGKIKFSPRDLSNPAVFLHNLIALNKTLYCAVLEKGYITVSEDSFLTRLREFRSSLDYFNHVYEDLENASLGWYRLNDDYNSIGNETQTCSINKYIIHRPHNSIFSDRNTVTDLENKNHGYKILLPYLEDKVGQESLLSIQIYSTLQCLKSLIDVIYQLPELKKFGHIAEIKWEFDEIYTIFEKYLKGVVVAELKATLNSDPDTENAVKAVERQLHDPIIAKILTKNHQSENEYYLKLLSVISIIFGVGIITTLGLTIKRYCDSGGSSINFFKPLSQNLVDRIDDIASNSENFLTTPGAI